MKICNTLVLLLVFTAMLMTGCGCRNSKPLATMPSESTTVPTTMATTEATTMPTTEATVPSSHATDATIDHGNGPLPTDTTEGTNGEHARSRTIPGTR